MILPSLSGAAEKSRTHLSLDEAETRALGTSAKLKASDQDVLALQDQAEAQAKTFYPRLSLDGSFRYVTEVPEIRLGPIRQPFGDNETYSVGPVLSYVLWDRGARSQTYRGFSLLAQAKEQERESVRHQILLGTRIAYTQAQLAIEEASLVRQSLDLARSQSRDLEQRYRAGAVSRVDLVTSQMEVASFEVRHTQATAEAEAALTELASWIGDGVVDASGGADAATAIEVDRLESAAMKARKNDLRLASGESSVLQAQEKLAEGLEASAEGQEALDGPTIQLQLKSSLDYPNGPNLEQVQQNAVMVGMSWTLFDGGRTRSQAAQKYAEARAARYRRQQSAEDLQRDWQKTSLRLTSGLAQSETATRVLRQAEEIARLKYDSYRAGKLSFFEVQTANLRQLDARLQKARIDAQALVQYYNLKFLSTEPGAKGS